MSPCSEQAASSLRRACAQGVAMETGDDGFCPLHEVIRAAPEHDPLCLAAARRDVAPCAALPGFERVSCEALVAHDRARCGVEARCLRLLDRWGPLIPLQPGKTPYEASWTLSFPSPSDRDAGKVDPLDAPLSLASDAAAGAVVVERGAVLLVHMGTLFPPATAGSTRAGLWLQLPAGIAPGASLTLSSLQVRAFLFLPSGLSLSMSPDSSAHLRLSRFNQSLSSGAIVLSVDIQLGEPGAQRGSHWEIDTWIRDRVHASELSSTDPW